MKSSLSPFFTTLIVGSLLGSAAFADKPDLIRALGLYDLQHGYGTEMPAANLQKNYVETLKVYLAPGVYSGFISSKGKHCSVVVSAGFNHYEATIYKEGSDRALATIAINPQAPVKKAIERSGVLGIQVISATLGKLRIAFIGTVNGNHEIAIENWGSSSADTSGASTQHCQGLQKR